MSANTEFRSTFTPAQIAGTVRDLDINAYDSSAPTSSQGVVSRPESSEDLLKYVLNTVPEGSLVNLTNVVHVDMVKDRVIGRGGFSDVYKGSMSVNGKDVDVAIKLFRLHCEGIDAVKIFAKELRVVSRLDHPNILKPLGYVSREGAHYYIVSEWMERGSLRERMCEFSFRGRFSMSLGIAKGMCYIHSLSAVHGDLRADNVLVSSSGDPLLSDFGSSRMKESGVSKGYYSTESSHMSIRWMAYEFYHHDQSEPFRATQKTDVWAFGMTMLELLTGDIPFAHIKSDNRVVTEIVLGRLPREPVVDDSDADADLKRFMWTLCLKCWNKDPEQRPSMQNVLDEIIQAESLY